MHTTWRDKTIICSLQTCAWLATWQLTEKNILLFVNITSENYINDANAHVTWWMKLSGKLNFIKSRICPWLVNEVNQGSRTLLVNSWPASVFSQQMRGEWIYLYRGTWRMILLQNVNACEDYRHTIQCVVY